MQCTGNLWKDFWKRKAGRLFWDAMKDDSKILMKKATHKEAEEDVKCSMIW